MPRLAQKTIKSEIGSQPTMCQVHTGTYVSLLAPGKTEYTACRPEKITTYQVCMYTCMHVYMYVFHTLDNRQ